jgi:endonuclease/exonuclease/phosphatase family metal-dependent hydrolase
MTVVQCYAPTENANLEEKEAFYSLDRTLLDIHRSDNILLMGDFNAQVGSDNQYIGDVVGKHGLPHRNENGDLLTELCGRHGLVIGGAIFPHKDCHEATWVSPVVESKVENQIDHICISKNWRKSLLDVCNKRGADIGSDHHLLMGIIRFFMKNNKKKHT